MVVLFYLLIALIEMNETSTFQKLSALWNNRFNKTISKNVYFIIGKL